MSDRTSLSHSPDRNLSEIDNLKKGADPFSRWKILLVEIGSFLIFAATYGQYVVREVWPIIRPLFHH